MVPYTLKRNMRNDLVAKTITPFGADRRELHIKTSKGSRGITCTAMVVQVGKDGLSYTHAFGLAGKGDYRVTLATSNARATEKAIRTIHESMLTAHHAQCLADAIAYYPEKVAA